MAHLSHSDFVALNIAVLTVSDSRNEQTDTSGHALVELATEAGHVVKDKAIVVDDIYQIRALVSNWIASADIQAVLITGGTGFTVRDYTVEALTPLFDKEIPGYGEMFRQVSLTQIGSSTMQSRAVAGMANKTVIFTMPGSTNACKTAWTDVIKEQLDARHKPCNFVPHLKQIGHAPCATRG